MFEYDFISMLEAARTNTRFIPYSHGSPSEGTNTFDEQYPRANLIFFTDSHVAGHTLNVSLNNTEETIHYENNCPVKIDAVIHGGDILSVGHFEKDFALAMAKPFFETVKRFNSPVLFTKGNHDLNDWVNIPENVINDKDWGELFLNYAEETYNIVRQTKASGDKSTWHYYDIDDKKIRIIIADIQDTDKTTTIEDGNVKYYGGKSWYISEEQMKWIVSDALNFDDKDEKDWGVIFAMHQFPSDSPMHQNAGNVLVDICDAFNNQKTYSIDYTFEDSFFNMNLTADFTRYADCEKKPHLICWLLGHNHEDKYENKKGVHLIWTTNHCCTSRYSDSKLVRIKGTSTQNCFDILNIDTQKRKIRMFRYGAGVNCFGAGGDRFLPDGLSY